MARIPRVRRLVRRCHHMLVIMVSFAVVAGLTAAPPARAATPARTPVSSLARSAVPSRLSSSVLDRIVRQARSRATAAAVTPPGGDVTIDVDPGISVDKGTLQQLVTQIQGENSRLSDSFKRLFDQYSAGSASIAQAPEFSTATDWQDFDGKLAVDSDGTGLSVTIPAAEVQTSATFWQNVVAAIVGVTSGLIIRAGCVAAAVIIGGPAGLAAKTICAGVGGFFGGLIRGAMLQGFDGTLGDAGEWSKTIAAALVAAIGASLWEIGLNRWAENSLPGVITSVGTWVATTFSRSMAWLGSTFSTAMTAVGDFLQGVGARLGDAVRGVSVPTGPSGASCDIYTFYGTPCAATYSMGRALYSSYNGPLYSVQRASDGQTADIGLSSRGGYVDASRQDSFCAQTTCTITRLYDQSPDWNDLTVEGAGGAAGADHAADAAALPITVGGHKAYGIDFTGGIGYRNNNTQGVATGQQPEGMYMVASGTHVNSGCCFDFGNAETNTRDTGASHMDAVNLTTWCGFPPCTGDGPWVQADLENGQYMGGNGPNPDNLGNNSNFVTAMLRNDGKATFALHGGDSQSGGLSKWWDGKLPDGYAPMHMEGAVVLGTGGDNSNWGVGSFFEGVMTQGTPTDEADGAVQANIVSAGYAGNSGGNNPPPAASASAAAGQAVVHDGYSSVFTVNASNGHLQETYLPKMFDSWTSQDLSAKYGTPMVKPGTQPVTLVHDGYTSVFTVDASNGHLQETYLPKMGGPWYSQDLSAKYGTPYTSWTPAAVYHTNYTSVYTVNAANGHLQETYLPKIGDPWTTQDLSNNYGSPQVQAGTSPVAIVHSGYTSVFTITPGHHLQETYLPQMGGPWYSQDLSAKYGTPNTAVTPTAVVHQTFTSLYTVDDGSHHLQETYLPKIGDPWTSQDLSDKYGTPWVAPGTQPVALVHTGYTSVYTVDWSSDHLQETYLPKIGDPWTSQDLSAKYGTPTTVESPIVLLHPDANGALTWSSVFTLDQFSSHLQETYLPKIGDPWTSQDLSAKYGTPAVTPTQFPTASWSTTHDGYTSTFTVSGKDHHLYETYLPAMNQPWVTQDLTEKYGTAPVMNGAAPVSLTHDGYTSVFSIDGADGHLRETYLPKMGGPWVTQDLSNNYGTPPTNNTPSAVFHSGYTSVYTVEAGTQHLWETYLPAIGRPWVSQDLTAKYGTPPVSLYTSPCAIVHSGWTSVFTVADHTDHLWESYLPAIGDPWITQDLTGKYQTKPVSEGSSPTAVEHSGWTSVYTVDDDDLHLRETYLPAIGDPWVTQDLSNNYHTPPVTWGTSPVALVHSGYTSVYTVDALTVDGSANHVFETYLPAIGQPWTTQDLTKNYGAPTTTRNPSALLHYDTSGGLTWTSVFAIDPQGDLWETYLPGIGQPWTSQDLSKNYGTPRE